MNTRSLPIAHHLRSGPGIAVCLLALFAAPVVLADDHPASAVPEVMSGAAPAGGVEELQLEEIWRRGGEDDEEVLLGIVTSVLSGPDGNIYVLDAQLMEVKVFDTGGDLVGTLGRQGEGPGEFNAAFDMVFMPDGTLGVSQSFPGKLIKLNIYTGKRQVLDEEENCALHHASISPIDDLIAYHYNCGERISQAMGLGKDRYETPMQATNGVRTREGIIAMHEKNTGYSPREVALVHIRGRGIETTAEFLAVGKLLHRRPAISPEIAESVRHKRKDPES